MEQKTKMEITKLQFDYFYPKMDNCDCFWEEPDGRKKCHWCLSSIKRFGLDPYKSAIVWNDPETLRKLGFERGKI